LAYRAGNGDVNYSVRKFDGYGKLSGKSLDELRAGERVAVQDGKEDPLDFVLWKSAKADEPADAKWASEFGAGRPGWHIECSAMCGDTLGAFAGGAGARGWRRVLSTQGMTSGAGLEVLDAALAELTRAQAAA
jgi:cysteinyl-tRNA synthetase